MFCSSALSYLPSSMVQSQAHRQRLVTGLYQHTCAFPSLYKRLGVRNCIVRAENDTKDENVDIGMLNLTSRVGQKGLSSILTTPLHPCGYCRCEY
jgi:hypothetical protein